MTIDIISIRDCININTAPNEKFVFVIAPFEEDRTEIYESIIKPAVEKKGLDCKRADDFKTNTNKLNNIIRNIWKSEFIIADLTGLNPNVMYELGFAHAMNKEVIMIFENNEKENKELDFPNVWKFVNDNVMPDDGDSIFVPENKEQWMEIKNEFTKSEKLNKNVYKKFALLTVSLPKLISIKMIKNYLDEELLEHNILLPKLELLDEIYDKKVGLDKWLLTK